MVVLRISRGVDNGGGVSLLLYLSILTSASSLIIRICFEAAVILVINRVLQGQGDSRALTRSHTLLTLESPNAHARVK